MNGSEPAIQLCKVGLYVCEMVLVICEIPVGLCLAVNELKETVFIGIRNWN